jgi:hypothetical protein
VFCGVNFCTKPENIGKKISVDLDTIEKYDIENDIWTQVTVNRGSLTPCHNIGVLACFGMHCQSEGMILFGGEYVAADTENPTVIQDVYLFSPDNN